MRKTRKCNDFLPWPSWWILPLNLWVKCQFTMSLICLWCSQFIFVTINRFIYLTLISFPPFTTIPTLESSAWMNPYSWDMFLEPLRISNHCPNGSLFSAGNGHWQLDWSSPGISMKSHPQLRRISIQTFQISTFSLIRNYLNCW